MSLYLNHAILKIKFGNPVTPNVGNDSTKEAGCWSDRLHIQIHGAFQLGLLGEV